jgi:ubiquinone biosynthesis protein Coq4
MGLLTMGQLFTLIREFEEHVPRIRAITRGWLMGRHAKPMFGVDWKVLWSEPLAQVRRRFEIDIEGIDQVIEAWDRMPPIGSPRRLTDTVEGNV